LAPALVAGLHNFGGGAGAGMGASGLAMLCGLLADGTKPAAIWRLLLPSILAVLFCGTLALVVLR
jgi:lactate permease